MHPIKPSDRIIRLRCHDSIMTSLRVWRKAKREQDC